MELVGWRPLELERGERVAEMVEDPTLDGGAVGEGVEGFAAGAIFDLSDPHSIINMVSDRVREAMLKVDGDLVELDEGELRRSCDPTHTDYALRVSFWREFDRAVSAQSKIKTRNIFSGICSEQYFYVKVLRNKTKVAWLVRPVQEYKKEMEALLARGTARLWELVDIPLKDANGKVDIKAGELLLRVVAELANRTKGMAVQRIKEERRSMNMHLHGKATQSAIPAASDDVESLKRKVAELEAGRVGKSLPAGSQAGVEGGVPDDRAEPLRGEVVDGEIEPAGVVRGDGTAP